MVLDNLTDFFNSIIELFPEEQKVLFSLIVHTILILAYSLFIWKFYRFLARREIIQLDLHQYRYSKHPILEEITAILLYTLEYLIILPFLVLFWFTVLSIFLLIFSESNNTLQILLISAAVISSIRITSYASDELSKELAKLLPLTFLAVFVLGENFLDLDKISARISEIPTLFENIFIFIVFIFAIEFSLRLLYSVVQFIRSDEED